jgi:hypothetical protein
MKDDYLWDPKSEPEPGESDVQHLERLLSRYRANTEARPEFLEAAWKESKPRGTLFGQAWFGGWRVQLAFAAVVLCIFAGGWVALRLPGNSTGTWQVARLEGAPQVGSQIVGEKFHLRPGQVLETDSLSSARIDVGEIGEVEVGPDSRVRLVEAQKGSGTLGLDQGTIKAVIWAPPRKFFVQTPAANTVDLGCAYTLHVGPDGNGWIRVTMGWVAFERDGKESFVPVDAMCLIHKGAGPGTPYYEDATQALRGALESLDFGADGTPGNPGRAKALALVLEQARRRDAITLWHLLARTSGDERAKVFDRLAQLVPPPAGVTREGVLGGDAHMRDLWWDALGLEDTGWWREWKRDFPSK